jgi:hypothetical protein
MYRKFTVYQEVTAPAGANFITFKHILNDFSLNIEVLSLTEKVDKERERDYRTCC